ncbi:MAG: carbamoyltransferase HypF [Acidobacteriota bacterium]
METRTKILVRGIVQGVGFRPYVYSLAKSRGLRGSVLNNESGVVIDLEGDGEAINGFVCDLENRPPALSNIESVSRVDEVAGALFEDFRILPSESNGRLRQPVAADTAVCDDCVREMFDPHDRRYRYPFINCTNCGPRFTLIENVPYDRERTTMRDFRMCRECRAEYERPSNRRFHAEPIACEKCGPRLTLNDANGSAITADDLVAETRDLLNSGRIVAVKGLGGYHLVCDALNAASVERLRRRKLREDKPFALMARSLSVIEKYCFLSQAERDLLTSRERPIVLLSSKPIGAIPSGVAPGVATLGFMLPYTPLHHLLFEGLDGPLVMTSGNISDEPIAYRDAEGSERLKSIADYFLTNDRRIHVRTDDSIARIDRCSRKVIVRRSRGYAPIPITTAFRFEQRILACGAELKNTFCLAKDNHAFLSHHIGDLENLETLGSFTEGIEHFRHLFDISPEVVAYDLHPEYLSSKYAQVCDDIGVKIGVQHHHAHIASCLTDNAAEGEVIGVAMDGLGFGTDGKLWGGEFFVADMADAERVAHLEYVPMPGGSKAIREPWRMAAVYLNNVFGDDLLKLKLPFVDDRVRKDWRTMKSMIDAGVNSPQTSSMGRLFDAVSALLCLRSTVNYEGQAAVALEAIADRTVRQHYQFDITADGIIRSEPVVRAVVHDLVEGIRPAAISARFHLSVADLIADMATSLRDRRNLNRVALSGGVFQNMFLLGCVCEILERRGFEVLTHGQVPTNDGGISLGQAAIANAQIRAGRV